MSRSFARLGVALVLILLAAVPRLPLLMAADPGLHSSGPGGRDHTSIGEELHRGTTAWHWITGRVLPVADYQSVAFHGGPFVTSALAVPLFLGLGPSLVSLKATGLVFHCLTLALLFLCLRRLGGRRAAWFGTILYAGTPPGYAILNLVAYGTHVEANAVALGILLLYLRWLERPSRARTFAVGAAAGFGLFFTYTVALTVAAVGLHALWTRRLTRGAGGTLAAGGLLGFAPWLYLNLRNGLAGLSLYGGLGPPRSGGDGPDELLARFQDLFTHGLPGASYSGNLGPVPAAALDWSYAALLLAGFIGLFLARRDDVRFDVRFLAVIPLLFLIAFGATHFEIGWPLSDGAVTFRYVYVLYPSLVLGLALLAARIAAAGTARRAGAWSAVVLVAAMGAAGSASYVDLDRWGADLERPGYDNRALGRFVALTQADRPDRIVSSLSRARYVLPRPELIRFQIGVTHTLYAVAAFDGDENARPAYLRRARAARDTLAFLDATYPRWADAVPATFKPGAEEIPAALPAGAPSRPNGPAADQ